MAKKNIIILGSIALVVLGLIIFNIANRANLSFSKVDDSINDGIKFIGKNQLENATTEFNRALSKDSLSYVAEYDKAITYEMKGNAKLADSSYINSVRKYLAKKERNEKLTVEHFPSKAFHNRGNLIMANTVSMDTIVMYNEMLDHGGIESLNLSQKDVTKLRQSYVNTLMAIESYKNSLRDNPKRDDTRFNLAFAQDYEKRLRKILEQIPNDDNQQNQNQNQNQNQEQQNQQDQQDKQDQQNSPEDERNQTDEKGEEKDDNIDLSKENAEQILKAMEKDEENTLKKVRLQQKQQKGKRIEKNW